uniref:DUF3656 domain-containing protein n=1 Tax=Caenorhabditis tropicalis TaxID=1561998 RepID=A0A1I7TBN0_9PELO
MTVLSTIVNGISEVVDTCLKVYEMNKGYKVTQIPSFPKSMELAESSTVKTDSKGNDCIRLILADESFDQVNPKSLEFMRETMRMYFTRYNSILELLEEPFPSNTIAISFGAAHFNVGDSCAKFNPRDGAQGSTSYQKMSANLLVTYFNKDDINFLAGYTYFPSLYGEGRCFLDDIEGIATANGSIQAYPVDDRAARLKQHKVYGRFCSLAKKRVLVDANGKYVRHREFDHVWNCYKYAVCQECIVDSVTYNSKKDPEIDTPAKIAKQLQELADNGTEISGTVKVFDTKGDLFTSDKRIVDLEKFLKENPSFNVHSKHALVASMVLGEEFKDRIGGEPVPVAEEADVAKPVEVAEEAKLPEPVEESKEAEVAEPAEHAQPIQEEVSDKEESDDSEAPENSEREIDSDFDAEIVN